jgi:hypothetical protein
LLPSDDIDYDFLLSGLAVELETFNRAERRVTEGRSYLRTTAGKESEKANDQSDMMKLMTAYHHF